jgi:GNAT superfamily N-acetyltransferase
MLTDQSPLRIESYDPSRHERDGFDCGVDRLNNYLKLSAKKQQKDDMTRVYVAVEEGQSRVLGYHAINLGRMNVDELKRRPRGAPEHGEIPILFLGQVAVDIKAQGHGIGAILMHHVFEKAIIVANQAGCHAVVLDVMSDGGEEAFERRKTWYRSYGFQSFASNDARMFMVMRQIREVVG